MIIDISELGKNPQKFKSMRDWMMEVMQFIFTRSQENINQNMPWGDFNKASDRKPTVITDTAALMLSGVPPFWDGDSLVFEYTAPHAEDTEYGSDPKVVQKKKIAEWAIRKLRMRPKAAYTFARNVVKKIGREGIPPHPFLRPAIHEGIARFNLKVRPPDL